MDGVTVEQDKNWVNIYFEGEEDGDPELTFNDRMAISAREDLTWNRTIGRIFRKAFKMGRQVERKQSQ